jgi:outer membrane murein-binding lipoprotein Lpp
MNLDSITTVLAAIGTAGAVVAMCAKSLAKLHDFVTAVADNTSAVVRLGEQLEQHAATTTSALTALDQRVTHLETSP